MCDRMSELDRARNLLRLDRRHQCWCWRNNTAEPQASTRPHLGPAVDDEDINELPMIAVWEDGMQRAIPAITVGRYSQMRVAPYSKETKWEEKGLVFRMEHSITHHSLEVRPRTDRSLLMSMYEQGSQVCMINVDRFKESKSEDERLKICFGIMKKICVMYSKDKLTKKELYPQRDKAFKEHPEAEHARAQKRTMETKESQPMNETDKESSNSKNKERKKGNTTANEHTEPEELESHEVKLEPADASPHPSGPTPVRRLKRKTNPEDATTPLKKPETKPEIFENKLEPRRL